MNNFLFNKTKSLLLKELEQIPQFAIITGSGIKLFENKSPQTSVLSPWSSVVKGHEGKLKLYTLNRKSILVFSGRRHLYEGCNIADVVLNVRLAYELGIKKIIITNAAGGIHKKFCVGDLMLITGFIDLMQGIERGTLNAIVQPPRKINTQFTKFIKRKFKYVIQSGVYAGCLGPSYETYAEIKLLKSLGACAVGMSTIPEMICAQSLGMDYVGISIISNVWNKEHIPSHHDVLKNVKKANDALTDLVIKLL